MASVDEEGYTIAFVKEFVKLNNIDVMEPLAPTNLSLKQKCTALEMVNLIKEKMDHTKEHPCLKGQSSVNGKQHHCMPKRKQPL